MAGHSKFKNIQYRKGAQDKKRAKQFAKIGREIQIAVKIGGTFELIPLRAFLMPPKNFATSLSLFFQALSGIINL